ncbi:hypothetical protein KY362_06080 [Candidatus Woesearchaeota archaeon]|nr:hypothetical protein [Candidatus Woesearchaeota archaeon]
MPIAKKAPKAKAKKRKSSRTATGSSEVSAAKPSSRELSRRKECPDCGSMNIHFDPETEQLICHDCGLLFEELPPELERRYEDASYF